MTEAVQCSECGAVFSPEAVDDLEFDQCPDCGLWASFSECDDAPSEDDDWWCCHVCGAQNNGDLDGDVCSQCGATRQMSQQLETGFFTGDDTQ